MINGIGTITSKAPVSVGRSARGAEVVAAAVAGHPGEAAGAVAEIFKSIGDELNQAKLNRNLERGFGRLIASSQAMDDTLRQGFASVVSHLGLVSGNVESLRADFRWGMGAVLWELEIQQKTLKDILETLKRPLDAQAKELRKCAEFAYRQGWYDEALLDFLESEKKNYQDFAVHQAIGNIYLYHQRPAKLEKARTYYLYAAKYADPHSPYHAVLAWMYAGFVCYLQRDDAAAIAHARRATELCPSLLEAIYSHAKFAAAGGQADVAIPSLERAVRGDRNYAIKARLDPDFEKIEAAVTELMERLRDEARQEAEAQWLPLRADLDRYAIPPGQMEACGRRSKPQ